MAKVLERLYAAGQVHLVWVLENLFTVEELARVKTCYLRKIGPHTYTLYFWLDGERRIYTT